MKFANLRGNSGCRRFVRAGVSLFSCTLILLLINIPGYSQGSTGRILGTVVDQTGGSIAGSTVTVIDTARNVTRTLTTDDAGAYNAPNLTPGNYTVTAEAKGFQKLQRQNVTVEVGHEIRVDLTLVPGEQSQTVTVTESVPLVETTNATTGGTLEGADITNLPLNGRDYQNLMGLRPGVMLQPGGGPWTQSTNGVRPDESVWMVEGVINVNFADGRPVMGMPSPFSDGATILPVDAIQEFNLMENPKAEYGWKAGAIVNVGIKSGTNDFHGSAYAFGRYQGWDARNFFNVAPVNGTCTLNPAFPSVCDQVPAQLKQFGGVVGGPIKKDKLFFFAGYEGLRSSIGFVGAISVPSIVSQGGGPGTQATSMVDALKALYAHDITPSPVSLALAGCTAGASPVCTGNLFPNTGTSNSYLSTFPTSNVSDNGISKIDYHPNDRNTISGMFYLGNYSAAGEDHAFTNQLSTNNIAIRTWSTTASWVYTPSSTVVNEMRFGYNRVILNWTNVDITTLANGTGYPIDTGITAAKAGGLPSIAIAGFGNNGTPIIGTAFNRPQYFGPSPYFDFQDSVSVLKGKHSFKFGGEFTHIEGDVALYNNGRGRFNFNGGQTPGLTDCSGGTASCPLEDFFAGNLTNATVLTGNPLASATWMNFAGFMQDDWRITPKLILNLGLRYQYLTPMKDANNNFGNFDPTLGMVQQGHGTDSVWKGDHRDFEPRIGFAYDLKGDGKTVIRGGSGIIHEGWVLATFTGQFGLQNDSSTGINAIPTAAQIICGSGIPCPSTGGGTNALGSATLNPAQLCWNAGPVGRGLSTNIPCPAGQATVLPPSATPKCGDGVNGAPSPCDLMGVYPGLKVPFIWNYNLGITHLFGNNISLDVEYVGNHGFKLLSFTDINQAPLGAAYCLNTLTAAQLADACASGSTNVGNATQEARPYFSKFPYLGFINYVNNSSISRYDSLQVTLTKRMSHGFLMTAGYTYGHGLDNNSLNRYGGLPQNSNDLAGEYASSDFDVRHRLTVTATYNIPGIKGFGEMLQGGQLNTSISYA